MALLLKNLLFTLAVPGVVAVLIPFRLAPTAGTHSPLVLFAMLILVVGGAVYFWCVWDFATFGRGTPAPIDAPKHLVVRGLYRYSRNPMYVGILTTITGWFIFFGLPLRLLAYLAIVAIVFLLFIVLYEEPRLLREFGSDYKEYQSKVGRWLPKRFKSTSA